MKKRSIFAAVVLLSVAVNAQGALLNCQQGNLLFPKQTLSTDPQNLDIVADQSEAIANGNYRLTGNVALNSNEYYLAADAVNINKSSKTSNASGNVKFQNHELMLTANKATIQKQNGVIHALTKQVSFHYLDAKINGTAKKISDDGTKQSYEHATYSTCPLGDNDWQIKADSIILDTSTNRGVAKNVTLKFFGIPILYTPKYKWVLKGRGSGLLAPSFSSYKESTDQDSAYQVRIPYYFNIAPDRDLLLTLNYLSSRGTIVEAVYRQLIAETDYWQGGQLEIEGHYLNKDDISNDKRWLIDSKLDLSINYKTDIALKVNRVSDVKYFEDIAHDNTSESSLRSEINLTYRDDEDNLALSLFAESEQLVNNGTATYTRAPELSISKGIQGLGGRYTDLSLISTSFKHKDASETTNLRAHLQANFQRLIATDAYSITPNLNLSHTNYAFDNVSNKNRNIATFNIDSKLFLEREISLFDSSFVQTLTPRLAYRYAPKKNQSALPNFDSADKNDTYESLFSGQEFTGLDRISNANNFTAGLESEFINKDTGDTYLSLKVAQTFYMDDQRLDITGNFSDQRDYSNVAATIDFRLNHLSFNTALQYNPETNQLDKRDSAITYHLSPRKFLTLAHNNDNDDKTAELYGAYPLTKKVHIFGGINRSITDSITNRATAGVAYESCCWALRLAHFKKHISAEDYERTTSIELVLKGLASTSANLARRLEKNIPNYLANLNE